MERTFQCQNELPRLPIPDLKDTLDKYLEWIEPLVNEEEYKRTLHIVNRFNKYEGPKLQNKLKKYLKGNQINNWTSPIWEDIYLKPRVPLIVEGNVFYLLDNKSCNKYIQSDLAARVIISALKFKTLIDEERLEVDRLKGSPLCMEQYKNFFSSTRIPGRTKDQLKVGPPSNHILVLNKGNLFLMNVYDPSGKINSHSTIKKSVEEIIQNTKGEGIGILTSLRRDRWAEERFKLIKLERKNKDYLEKIESAIFAVCLDQSSPQGLVEISKHMLHGEGDNRWFDKAIQFIITRNSITGINMEHTGMDGSTMSTLIQFLFDNLNSIDEEGREADSQKPEKINFLLNDKIRGSIANAKERFMVHANNNYTRVLVFNDFGTNDIKKFGLSPDAFVQIAIQWAQYMLFRRFYSQYEAVMTRKYLSGRIEVMYSVSTESFNFIESMEEGLYNKDIRRELFKKATLKHVQRVKECQNGKGVDSHLMALLEMYNRYGEGLGMTKLPAIFDDISYRILTHSTICTSTTSPYGLKLAGWGPVVEDGFAIRYIKYHDRITFNMVSREYKKKDLDNLEGYLKDALNQLADLMGN